jgi:hypothetical protein
MRNAFWNSTTVEAQAFGSSTAGTVECERHLRTSSKALRVPDGVMWQSEAPLNPSRHSQRLTTKTQTTRHLSQKTALRAQAPAFWL